MLVKRQKRQKPPPHSVRAVCYRTHSFPSNRPAGIRVRRENRVAVRVDVNRYITYRTCDACSFRKNGIYFILFFGSRSRLYGKTWWLAFVSTTKTKSLQERSLFRRRPSMELVVSRMKFDPSDRERTGTPNSRKQMRVRHADVASSVRFSSRGGRRQAAQNNTTTSQQTVVEI